MVNTRSGASSTPHGGGQPEDAVSSNSPGGAQRRSAGTIVDAFHDTAIRAQEGDLKTFGGTNQNLPVCARYQNPQRTPFTEWFHENFIPNVLVPMCKDVLVLVRDGE